MKFLFGLVDVLHMLVRRFRLKTLVEAYSLAKLQEMTVVALKEQLRLEIKTLHIGALTSSKPVPIYHSNYPTTNTQPNKQHS